MKFINVLCAVVGFVPWTSYAQQGLNVSTVRLAATTAVRWHLKWMANTPHGISTLNCSAAIYETTSFVLCQDLKLSIHLVRSADGSVRANYIGHESDSFDKAVTLFHRNISPTEASKVPFVRFSLSLNERDECTVDWRLTKLARASAVSEPTRITFSKDGKSLRYPLVCKDDPFYLLYFMSNDVPQWLWLFEIKDSRFEMRWSYESDNKRRPIPNKAIENLKQPELWYRTNDGSSLERP